MVNKKYIAGVGILLLVGVLFFSLGNKESAFPLVSAQEEITLYKSLSCGCCVIYGNYLEGKGNENLNVINLDDLDNLKNSLGIPSELQSCHTSEIGDYFVEGHIPLGAIEKLLNEKPDIKGIAMSGMPSGSPGMPGVKTGDFVIYAVNHDGSYEEFMRI